LKGQFCYIDAYQEPNPSERQYIHPGEGAFISRRQAR